MPRHDVSAPIAGSVWSHVAGIGQRVEVGATLLILEVMKTEYPIEAPVGGVVLALKPTGETVEVDEVIVTIEV